MDNAETLETLHTSCLKLAGKTLNTNMFCCSYGNTSSVYLYLNNTKQTTY